MSDTRITVAVDTDEELDLSDRLRLVKLANNVTYDRYAARTFYSVVQPLNDDLQDG